MLIASASGSRLPTISHLHDLIFFMKRGNVNRDKVSKLSLKRVFEDLLGLTQPSWLGPFFTHLGIHTSGDKRL